MYKYCVHIQTLSSKPRKGFFAGLSTMGKLKESFTGKRLYNVRTSTLYSGQQRF
jgi:hypothetical protein